MEIRHCKRISKNNEEHKGLFLTENFKKDNIVHTLEGPILDKPTKFSIEIGKNQHIIDDYGVFMNHSFEPTVQISGKSVIALKDLEKGSEICFNYNESETSMVSSFLTENELVFWKKF